MSFSIILEKIKWGLKRAVDVIYPPCCPFCDKQLKRQEFLNGICNACQKKLVYITDDYCVKCGKPVETKRTERCRDCEKHGHYFHQARSLLSYQGKTTEALYRFKCSNRREYARFFCGELVRMREPWIKYCKPDCLVPIPLYKKKEGLRGYNQAEILAWTISEKTGIPVVRDLLIKISDTRQQKTLSRDERRKNLEQVFRVNAHREIVGKNVMLVDDIYTTGATADAVAKVLRQAGAAKIYVLTIAIGG